MTKKTFEILSIEDNEPDFSLLKKALTEIPDIFINLTNIANGQSALDYIFKRNIYKNSKTPHLIILDINLPKMNGHEILRKIKRSKKYKIIPVIMFSSSMIEDDIRKSYEEYANSYIAKSFDVKSLFEKIKKIGEYWLTTSEIIEINNN